MYHFNWSLPKICYSNAYRMTHIQRRDEDKNNSENYVNIEEQKIGQYSFAEGLWEDLSSATCSQFYNQLQLKLSVNSLKKNFSSLPIYSRHCATAGRTEHITLVYCIICGYV